MNRSATVENVSTYLSHSLLYVLEVFLDVKVV